MNQLLSHRKESYYREYLQEDSKEHLINYMSKMPFFVWCMKNSCKLSDDMLKVLANVFCSLDDSVNLYKKEFLGKLSDVQKATFENHVEEVMQKVPLPKYTYQTIQLLGYTGSSNYSCPVEELFDLRKSEQEIHRGVFYSDSGRRNLEINTFTRYALSRINLVQSECGDYYIYSSKGYYKKAEVPLLKQIFRVILDEYDDQIWSTSYEKSYLAALVGLVKIEQTITEGNHDLINFTNGVLNIKTYKFSKHSPSFYTVNQLPYTFDPEANCHKFDSFLQDIFEEDEERVQLIQQLLGYVLLREIKIQKAFIFLGNGSNGKSILAEIITELLGKENVSTTPLSKLNGTFAMQNIHGKLANISTENEVMTTFNTQEFKALTSGDMVEVEKKYKDAYSVNNYTKIIIVLNKMMDSDDMSDGYYRRLQIIPFNKTYHELKQGQQKKPNVNYMNPLLLDELKKELPGIMNFALKGLRILEENNFRLTSCSESDKALEVYKRQQNPMSVFVDECVKQTVGDKIKRSDITKSFESWLIGYGVTRFRNLSKPAILEQFQKELEKRNWQSKLSKIQGEWYFTNLEFVTKVN